MNITLSPEQVKLSEAQLALGELTSPEEVITKALQTLMQTRKHYWEWVEDVRSGRGGSRSGTIAGRGNSVRECDRAMAEKFGNKQLNNLL